ncbi:NAD(P)H-binding protein [Paenibacillus hodogayensis]|uniref:NAD(P)H-binding protein n=1 Tax=Paenibacillus hodogayensis TaxID=279208 RepID=A0ABV5VVS5_9BACL
MTILVTGATGNVGRHVVHTLFQSGRSVRALSRNPKAAILPEEVEVVYGDLTMPETLVPVLKGIEGIFLLTSSAGGSPLQTGSEIIELAVKAGVRRIVMLWNGEKGTVERATEASDLEWTHIHPYCEFMSNTLAWTESIRTERVVREPFGDTPNAVIHEADVAAVAATVLTQDGHAGKTYVLTGPEALTPRDKARMIGEALGRNIRFSELSKDQAHERMKTMNLPEDVIEYVLHWHENLPAEAYTVVPTVKEVTGQQARTFAQWVTAHIQDFS